MSGTVTPAATPPSEPAPPAAPPPAAPAGGEPPESRWSGVLRSITQGNFLISVFAVLIALVVGGILIAATDDDVAEASGYFFARPADTFREIWDAVSGAYIALFQGSIYDFRRDDPLTALRSLTRTLEFATPLIAAGLGVAVAFRVGLFNIGGRGQILIGASFAGYAAFTWDLPYGLHLVVAVLMGLVGGALWAGIAGLLKARTGAHEVIVTIMLNYVAFNLVDFLLRTPLLQRPGTTNPITPATPDSAKLPQILGAGFDLRLGFVLVIAATIAVWWLLERSSLGFRFRAVGINPSAARVAGIDVNRVYIYAMLIAGALAGLAGANQVLGTVTTGFGSGVDAGIGFDAITVALLGRSSPAGVFAAGVLFGAFKAGGFTMQASENISVDVVLVVQSVIVLLIAAPPLVRTIFPFLKPRTKLGAGVSS